ncbi:MAG: hypothetical protein QG670_1937 [Thermoproteota archaeon]|nr:hypothetical protein [Thermoproteota archaeon]
MTKIRKVVKKQYYMRSRYSDSKTGEVKTKYKRQYEVTVYVVQFPQSLDVTDLLGKELVFERKNRNIIIIPK